MFNPTVFSLSVLPDGDQVHICVGGLVAFNGRTGAHIGVEVKGFPQKEVHGGMASRYRCLQRTCRLSNSILLTTTQIKLYFKGIRSKPMCWVSND